MSIFLLRRLCQAVFVIAGVTCVTFFVLRLVPGDPARLLVPQATDEATLQLVRQQLGTDKPLLEQFARFVAGALSGDLGESYRYRQPVVDLLSEAMIPTLALVATSMLTAVVIALPLGVIAAVRPGGWLDRIVLVFALTGQALPSFWLAVMLVLLLAVNQPLLPAIGMESWTSFVLPTMALATGLIAVLLRTVRQSMLEALGESYVRTARAKGLPVVKIVGVHALKNASLPFVTVLGLQLGILIGNAFVIEAIFHWPGLGSLGLQAVQTRDFPVLQGVAIVVAVVFVLANLAVDIVYAVLDPRIRITAKA